MSIQIQKTHKLATFKKAHPSDIGYDLTACEYEVKLEYDSLFMVDLGIKVCPPDGYYFKIYPRSSLAKTGFILPHSAGLIDPGYRGVLGFPMRYIGRLDRWRDKIEIRRLVDDMIGKRIAQAELCFFPRFETEFVQELAVDTDRGAGGFGSTDS